MLSDSEQYARSIINSSLDMIITVDNERKIVEFNKAAEEAFGYRREEVLGKHITLLYASADAGSSVHNNVFVNGRMRGEILNRRKNGEIFPSLLSASVLCDTEGRVVGVVGVSRDISDLKRAEEDLRKSEETVRLLLDSTAEAVCGIDLHGVCTFANPAFLRLTGFDRIEEVIGRHLHPMVHHTRPDGSPYPVDECKVHHSLKSGESVHADDEVFWRADGTSFYVEYWSHPVYRHGQVGGSVVTFVDISERKQAEWALRESEQRHRSLFENMLEGYAFCRMLFDHDKPQDFIYVDVNNAFEALTGLKNVVGKKATEVIPGIRESNPELFEIYGRVALTGTPERFETYVESLGIWFSIAVYSPGKQHFVAMFDNITERKRMEKAAHQLNTELAGKNAELEQIVYVTSHDLRSPLVNIQGFGKELELSFHEVQSFLREMADPSKERVLSLLMNGIPESLHYIRSSTVKMNDLLNGLLRLSRLGRAALVMKQLDMSKMMAEIMQTFEFVVQQSHVRVCVEPLPPCFGDETQIHRIFSNLIDNALKYLDPHRPGRISISGSREGAYSTYRIEDNGIGIPPEYQDRIFEIFHRLDPSRGDGEGLGLTIARKILDRHHGSLRVESQPGSGSSFHVTLPAEGYDENAE
jgi:PAS domain S-box-containing protein